MKRRAFKKNTWADHYTRKARKERYPARSVYKLKEIQQKTGLIRKGNRILDLGCAPGSWMLEAAELTGPGGRVVGIDLKPVTTRLPDHATAHVGDMLDMDDALRTAIGDGYDVVLSDMAPATTGIKSVDALRSFALSEAALAVALDVLEPGGGFICKIFQGSDFQAFIEQVKQAFSKSKIFKPQSSRKASKEIFVIGLGKK